MSEAMGIRTVRRALGRLRYRGPEILKTALRRLCDRDHFFGDVLYPSRRRIRQYTEHVEMGRRVLDMGTGTGVLARLALERGAKEVVAVDINPAAVAWARRAVPGARVLLSDLFSHIEGAFDTILFSAPWSEGAIVEDVHQAVFDHGVTARFLKEAPAHLAPGGAIWLQYCDASPRNFAALKRTLAELNYSIAGCWRYRTYDLFARKRCHIYTSSCRHPRG